ncbi:hypothetical protein JCM19037_2165 [Geomicrobium sp. JCM 19037]|uniref:DUF1659 domain-containing protein n=1 Tax=unclassified Geomicrobium TaxID=2628951 RepID=UPI00045F4AF5|nr:DUF1659 domain-containing protein [Geomicrobium sp. JCM 19037]GAK03814.1 hypothetical protein JCM19037_2165 [Geomicrobium sp. JCM 19037]
MQPANTMVELRFLEDFTEEGEEIHFVRRMNNVKASATDGAVRTVMLSFSELTELPLVAAIRRNDYDLLQQQND